MSLSEVIKINKKIVACDGGDRMGHPTIYLYLNANSEVKCPYCSQGFIYKDDKKNPQ